MRSALRIGITGHRLDKLAPGDLDALRAQLSGLFAALDGVRARRGTSAAPRIVSGLAEGADRLAVEASPDHWLLDAVLPLPRDEYRRDFLAEGEETSHSARAFDAHLAAAATLREPEEADPDRDAAYAALGQTLIRDIDCLVAVWDGQKPRGPGGTAAVLADAVALGVPVLWVDPAGSAPVRLVTGFIGGDVARPLTHDASAAELDAIAAGPPALSSTKPRPRSSC